MKFRTTVLTGLSFVALAGLSPAHAAADEAAAQSLAKKSDCFKCHAVDMNKKGPSFQTVAAKYKGKADGEASVVKFLTSGGKIAGSDDTHKTIDTKDEKGLKNLAQWILTR